MRSYLTEMIGTLILSLAVMASFQSTVIATPLVAALTLGLLVYLLGPISGCHINPAVSFGLKWANLINTKQLFGYVISQFAGAGVAYLIATSMLGITWAAPQASAGMMTGVGEILGTTILVMGVILVVMNKISYSLSGLIIGSSLLLGIVIAATTGAGVLNPAVAISLRSGSTTYLISPLIGAILGVEIAKMLKNRE